jgi:hypothetical protein
MKSLNFIILTYSKLAHFFLHYLCFYLVNHIIIFKSDNEWDDEKAADLPFKLTINHLRRTRFAEFNENIDQMSDAGSDIDLDKFEMSLQN